MRNLLFIFFAWISVGQQLEKVDFISLKATLTPDVASKSISGEVLFEFNVLKFIDTIKIDAKKMDIKNVFLNGKKVNFKNTAINLQLFEGFNVGKNKLIFFYEATPKQALYFVGENEDLQIWTQGQGKYTSHWLPSFDDVNEKMIFSLSCTYDSKFSCVANGELKKMVKINEKTTHRFEMKKPMSSYLVMLAIGKFTKKLQKTASRIPLELYLNLKDSLKFEPTFRYSAEMIPFLEKEIGHKYPWKIYKQLPIRDFLYAGMENTSATIFAQDFVVDTIGFQDQNYVNINAHELAHHWFGNLVTAKSSKHHWLQEGFATFYASKVEKEFFGDDYFYYKLYENALLLEKTAKIDTIPMLNEKASSLTFYQKGALALFFLENEVGTKNFKKAIKQYLKKNKFKTVETSDFLNEIANVSKFDILEFEKNWLQNSKFIPSVINSIIEKSSFLKKLVEIKRNSNKTYESKKSYFLKTMQEADYFPVKTEILEQIEGILYEDKKEILAAAMKSNSVEVRQSVAKTLTNVPNEFRTTFETLLDDKSNNTREIAFEALWNSFPENRANYLNKAKNWYGNNDKRLRILYLIYSQLDMSIENSRKKELFLELLSYSDPSFESSIRQNALEAVLTLQPNNITGIRNLVNATTHFKWQFSKYAKEKLKKMLQLDSFKELLKEMETQFSAQELIQISKFR